MVVMASGQNEWSSQYVVLEAEGDYIEWTFNLTSTEASQLNTGVGTGSGWILSNRTTASAQTVNSTFTINGLPVLGSARHGIFQPNFIWTVLRGPTYIGAIPYADGPYNYFLTGVNTLRLTLGPLFGPVTPIEVDFVALELSSENYFIPVTLDYYEYVEYQYFYSPPGFGGGGTSFTPSWYSGHSNPTYNHGTADGAQPTFILKATAGTTGHSDLTSFSVTNAARTSSNAPLISPLVVNYTASLPGSNGSFIIVTSDNRHVLSRGVISGGVATVTGSYPFAPPSNTPPGGGLFLYFGGDPTRYNFDPLSLTAELRSPQITDVPSTAIDRYTYTFHAEFQMDDPGPPDYIHYVANEQIPSSYLWNDGDGGLSTASTMTHEYPHHMGTYDGTVETTGLFDAAFGVEQPNIFFFSAFIGPVDAWLRFTSDDLLDPTFEPFTDLPFSNRLWTGAGIPQSLHTDKVNGFVVLAVGNDPEIDAYPVQGGSRVASYITETGVSEPGPNNIIPIWCFDSDFTHVWGIDRSSPPFFVSIDFMYGVLGGTFVKRFSASDIGRFGIFLIQLCTDEAGFLYILWNGNHVDKVDSTGNLIQTYTLSSTLGSVVSSYMMDVSGSNLYVAGIVSLFSTTIVPDGIWVIDTDSGQGQGDYAFTSGTNQLITGLSADGRSRGSATSSNLPQKIRAPIISSIQTGSSSAR